jgi:C-terminal processing protease CtpA/Prc
MDLRDVIKMIRGKKGTGTLTILDKLKHTYRFDVTIVRVKFDIRNRKPNQLRNTDSGPAGNYQFGVIDLLPSTATKSE